ncbi:MAG TPA: metal ABC transporter ATP-binding protein [Pedococcus sp.]|nr:metal ABC transporter ATP-binding protein [Pedococcus sp.]
MSGAPAIIELRSAAFGYAERAVIAQLSLRIDRGEVVALLGPNGSGKSTLVKGLLGLSDQLGGQVTLFGVDRAAFTDKHRIGYVPQRHSLSTSVRATVREVVEIGRLPHRRWWAPWQRGDAAIVQESLELVGLADRAHEDVSTLSGGQQRRVLIARALAAQPEVLVMDEPTAGVDTASQAVLADVLSRLAARGTTMLIVTHELDALTGTVTRVLCTNSGRIDYDGSLADYIGGHACAAEPVVHHHADELTAPPAPSLTGAPAGPLDSVRSGGGND